MAAGERRWVLLNLHVFPQVVETDVRRAKLRVEAWADWPDCARYGFGRALQSHIVDPTKSVIAIENVNAAINQISQTTVRNVVGQFSLDQLLSQTLDINAKIKDVIDGHTEPWGAQVSAVEIKDITLPDNMQRAMAKEAEAERERRAKIVAAEGEFQAAVKLGEAADIISQHPVALQLRTLQTMAEISIEKNSTIIFPAQFMTTVQEAIKMIRGDGPA